MDRLADEARSSLARFGPQAGIGEAIERWPEAVGEAIARNAWPARIARDGTLHVATADSVWAFELGHRAVEIATRLGVPAVRFAPGPLPEEGPTEPTRNPVRPTADHERAAAAIAAEISDENLRESIQKAVSFGLAKAPLDRSV